MSQHEIIRMRHENRRRKITVATVQRLSPRMLRIRFESSDLDDFTSPSPDDHIKLFFPSPEDERTDNEPVAKRDFTPRLFSPKDGTLTVDFALHENGPATEWAIHAQIGDSLEMGGPRGSMNVPDDFDWYILIGDESALPSIGRRVEGLRSGVPVTTIVAVHDDKEIQTFSSQANWNPIWVLRENSGADG